MSSSGAASSSSMTPISSNDKSTAPSYQYGSLVSQYNTIAPSVVALLEEAALYRGARAFASCGSIYDSIDSDSRRHPVVAYEEFLANWAQWRLLDCAKVLENALHWAETNGKDIRSYGLYTLLRIALGQTEVFMKGNFTVGRNSMREVRRWLKATTVDEYTDVEITSLSHYYNLILMANHVTDNFDDGSFRQIPIVSAENDRLNLTQLREVVQRQGRLRDARLILGFEHFFHQSEDAKQEAWQSLLQACSSPGDREPRWTVESVARSMLAQSLRRAGNLPAAERETRLAIDLLVQSPVNESENKSLLYVEFEQLRETPCSDSQQSLKTWTDFSMKKPVKEDPKLLSTALGRIADAAFEVLQAAPTVANKASFWEWQLKNEELLEQLGDLYFLYMSKLYKGQVALRLFDEFGAAVQWQEKFHAKHPHFALWSLVAAGKRTLALLYSQLKQQEQVIKTYSEMSQIMRHRDNFWIEGSAADEQYAHQSTGDMDLVSMTAESTKYNLGFKAESMREQWSSEWADTGFLSIEGSYSGFPISLGPQIIQAADPHMTTLLRWLKSAVNENEIGRADLELLLEGPESEDGQRSADGSAILEKLTPATLKLRLHGSKSSPIFSVMWQKKFSILQGWLFQRAKYHETKRHVLLATLQAHMIDIIIGNSRHEDVLCEAQRMVDLIPTLCDEARKEFTGTTVNWRNIACAAKRTVYSRQNVDLICNEELPEFVEILDMYKISLKESKDEGSLPHQAITLLSIAHHYYFAALKLRPAALASFFEYLDAADTVYNRSRESWKILKGWAKVEKLLGAVQEQMRNVIAPSAALVICEFPDGDQRERGLWTVIQMAKSNGLGWLMRTNQSTQKIQIEDVERLDVEFEELPTWTADELKPISEHAGDNFVYVDWYNGSWFARDMPKPLILGVASDGSMKASFVPMTWKAINSIIDDFSFEESALREDDALKMLQKLSPLVEPLAAITKPGQTLVFSPIGSLHRLPLHALTLDGEILIRRNPIVYCSSFTVLNVVFEARKAAERQEAFDKGAFRASLFGDPPSRPGQEALALLAKKFSTEAQIGDASTSSNFAAAMIDPGLNLLHYHGHVTFHEGDPKSHGLELDDRRFTLRDVFDLAPLPNCYHATLLGCGSGMSKTTSSNDVVGLVPAFLYSGAASTVSTLWPFDDKDAALYTKYFYEEFDTILQSGRKGVVDLAKANQKAVLTIMEERPALYHWAPFVLNGYWMLRLPGK